jgi:hypothetical protein
MDTIINKVEAIYQKRTGDRRPRFWQVRVEASLLYIDRYVKWLEKEYLKCNV